MIEHHLELKESVLHYRLCLLAGVDLPYVLALAPGKIDLGRDVCAYTTLSEAQQQVTRAKSNWKRLLRVYAARWRAKGVKIDLQISLGQPMGRQRYMLASLPEWHAQRLEALFAKVVSSLGGVGHNIWLEEYDPHVCCGINPWLFEDPPA